MRKKIRSIFNNIGINRKFSFSLLIIIIIPTLILMFVLNHFYSKYLLEKNGQFQLEKLKQAKISVGYLIDDISYISKEILADNTIHKLLLDWPEQKEKDLPEANYFIQSLMLSRDYIDRVSIHKEEQTLLQFGGYTEKESDFPYNTAKENKGSLFWFFNNGSDIYGLKEQNYFCLGRAINDFYSFDNIIGYESIYIPESTFYDRYADLIDNGNQKIMILDSYGTIISSNIKADIGKQSLYYTDTLKNSKSGFFYSDDKSIISYSSFDNNDWIIMSINENIGIIEFRIINSIFIISLILILVFYQLFLLIQRKTIINPLLLLRRNVKEFADNQVIKDFPVYSSDEIGELTKNFIDMEKKINILIDKEYKSRIREQESKLIALQSQINPHFLYNTLDSLRWMAIANKQTELSEQIQALSNLFKHALNNGNQDTTVRKDLEHLKDYIKIQKNRFGDRFKFEINAEEKVLDYQTIKLILQPLVENAIYHGLEPKIEGGTIQIRIYEENNFLIYCIVDDGVGTDKKIQKELESENNNSNDMFALKNIQERIKLRFGREYGISFESSIGKGTSVTVKLPVNIFEKEIKSETINC